MNDSHDDASLAFAPEAQRDVWMRQYVAIVVVLTTLFEAFAVPRAVLLGFTGVDGAIGLLYVGFVPLFLARARSETLVLYTLFGFGVGQVFAFVAVGFAGPAALIPSALPVLTALFVGGRAPYRVLAASLFAFAVVGVLRVETRLLPNLDPRLVDPRIYANWVTLALALAAVAGPLVWLVGRLTRTLQSSFDALVRARSAHEAQVRLRVAAEAALEVAVEGTQEARRAEASGLLVAGVVHDLRNNLSVLQLATHALAGELTAEVDGGAVLRIRALCAEASDVSADLLRVATPHPTAPPSHCFVAEQTETVASVLRKSLPSDFRITSASALVEDREVAVDAQSLTSTLLAVIAAADVASARERRIGLSVREPTASENATLAGCTAVVQVDLGSASAQVRAVGAELLTRRGGRMLLPRAGEGDEVRLLLPPVPSRTQPEAYGG